MLKGQRTIFNVLSALTLVLAFSLVAATPALAATKTASVAGNWDSTATWGGSAAPTTGDDVIINVAVAYNLTTTTTVSSLTVNSGGALNFSSSGSGSLTVTGNVTNAGTIAVVNVTGAANIHTLTVGGNFTNNNTFTAAAVDDHLNLVFNGAAQSLGGTTATVFQDLTINAGATVTATNNFSIGNDATTGTVIPGAFTVTGTFTPGTYKVSYTATVAQTVANTTYYNLTINNTNGVTLNSSPTISGTLTLTSGAFGVGTNTLTLNGTISATSGSITSSATGTVIYGSGSAQAILAANYGNLTSSGAGARTLASSGTVGVAGTFTPGTNSYTITEHRMGCGINRGDFRTNPQLR
jgi:hypothetical protein